MNSRAWVHFTALKKHQQQIIKHLWVFDKDMLSVVHSCVKWKRLKRASIYIVYKNQILREKMSYCKEHSKVQLRTLEQ